MKVETGEGTIRAGDKSATVNKESVTFQVPNDIIYKYQWDALEDGDIVVESEHVKAEEVLSAVNTVRKNNARQNSYMSALAPYKPDTMSQEDRIEVAKRNLLQAKVPAELVEQTISAMRAQVASL